MQYPIPIPYSSFGPSSVGVAEDGAFRDLTLSVDCRYRISPDVVRWAFWGVVAGSTWGAWQGSIADQKARRARSSKRRKQREQSKRRREQKGKTSKGRLVGSLAEERRRRTGDFQVGYSMQRGARWGLIAGSTAGVGRTIWRFLSDGQPMEEAECRNQAIKRLKGDPSWDWGLMGAVGGALIYIAQVGSREPLRAADAETDRLGLYSVVGGVGALAMSKWFS